MRWRLILAFLLVIVVTLLSMSVWINNNTSLIITSFIQRGGNFGIEPLVNELEEFYREHGNWKGVETVFDFESKGTGKGMMGGMNPDHMPQYSNRLIFDLVDLNGELIYSIDPSAAAREFSADILESSVKLSSDGKPIAYLVPEESLMINTVDFSQALSEKITTAAISSIAISGALSVLLAITLGSLLLRPVNQLSRSAEALAQGNFESKVHINGAKELVNLGETFNYLSTSLQQAEAQRQAMTADIAHELRTPLAIQRANLEAMLDGIYPINAENLRLVLDQNAKLNKLVEDLRLLALSDANQIHIIKQTIDLNELLNEAIKAFQPQADNKKITLSFHGSEPISLISDPDRITQIVNNVVANALRHTPEQGHIEIRLEKTPSHATVSIKDSGEGIPQEMLPRIFDRFVRADSSRSRDRGGSGLGLTIAKQLAKILGGDLTANNHPAGGAVFMLSLPMNNQQKPKLS